MPETRSHIARSDLASHTQGIGVAGVTQRKQVVAMAIKMQMSLTGVVVAAVQESGTMKDRETGLDSPWTTRRLFVSQGFDADPVEVKLRAEQVAAFDTVVSTGPFCTISCTVKVQQFGNKDATLGLVEMLDLQPGTVATKGR